MKYRLLIDYEVIEFLEALSKKDQRLLRDRIVSYSRTIRKGIPITQNPTVRAIVWTFTFAEDMRLSFGKIMPTST